MAQNVLVERDGIRTHDLLVADQALFQLSYTPSVLVERDGIRTHDLLIANQALFQLSYTPKCLPPNERTPVQCSWTGVLFE